MLRFAPSISLLDIQEKNKNEIFNFSLHFTRSCLQLVLFVPFLEKILFDLLFAFYLRFFFAKRKDLSCPFSKATGGLMCKPLRTFPLQTSSHPLPSPRRVLPSPRHPSVPRVPLPRVLAAQGPAPRAQPAVQGDQAREVWGGSHGTQGPAVVCAPVYVCVSLSLEGMG